MILFWWRSAVLFHGFHICHGSFFCHQTKMIRFWYTHLFESIKIISNNLFLIVMRHNHQHKNCLWTRNEQRCCQNRPMRGSNWKPLTNSRKNASGKGLKYRRLSNNFDIKYQIFLTAIEGLLPLATSYHTSVDVGVVIDLSFTSFVQ